MREHVAAAETGKTGACHLFRHTMATLMLEGGRGHPLHPRDARARRAVDDADLHARFDPKAEGGARADASVGQTRTSPGSRRDPSSRDGEHARELFSLLAAEADEETAEDATKRVGTAN